MVSNLKMGRTYVVYLKNQKVKNKQRSFSNPISPFRQTHIFLKGVMIKSCVHIHTSNTERSSLQNAKIIFFFNYNQLVCHQGNKSSDVVNKHTNKGAIKQKHGSSTQKDVTGILLELQKFYYIQTNLKPTAKRSFSLNPSIKIAWLRPTLGKTIKIARGSLFPQNIQFIYVFYECWNVNWRVLIPIPGGNRVVYYNKTSRECFYDNFLRHIKPNICNSAVFGIK